MDSAAGDSSAAATPCAARPAISWPAEWESPDTSDAAVNAARPSRNAEEQQAAEAEGVGGRDPGQGLAAEGQVVGHGGQGQVHGGDVDDQHELRDAEQGQGGPAAVVEGVVVGVVEVWIVVRIVAVGRVVTVLGVVTGLLSFHLVRSVSAGAVVHRIPLRATNSNMPVRLPL
jgi:hypothetical protein